MMKSYTRLLATAALVLSACGGSETARFVEGGGGGPALIPPFDSSTAATFDAATDTLTLANGPASSVLALNPTYDTPGFAGFRLFDTGYSYASRAATGSGGGYALVAISPVGDLGMGHTGYGRLTPTELPSEGPATMTGTYAAWIASTATFEGTWLLKGAAAITADFDAMTVTGTISGRVSAFNATQTFADITLPTTDLTVGAFDGIATGGQGTGALLGTTSGGTVAGAITGPTGGEAVGTITLSHDISGTAYTEYGAFVAE